MKTKRLLSILLTLVIVLCTVPVTVFAADGDVAINEVNFPDATFRAYVKEKFDTNNDGTLSAAEIGNAGEINVNSKGIKSLKGVEYFTSLTKLLCSDNHLSSIDVSSNTALEVLYCWYNVLTAVDMSNNTSLKSLNCFHNQLTSLDVSNNTELTSLCCYDNKLTLLDVSGATALNELDCRNNPLTTLDLSENTALTNLDCSYNKMTSLDLSKNTALTNLNCSYSKMTSLDVSNNTALTNLDCHENQLTTLDLSKNTALVYLYCNDNELTSLDLSKNTELMYLYCHENQLTTLDLSKNTALNGLYCHKNKLTTLDVSKNTALTGLNCYDNELTSLDVSKNTALTGLNCYDNELTTLDVSKNTALTYLNCSYNKMTSLDLSKNTALVYLYCANNRLTSLDLSKNSECIPYSCADNEYTITIGEDGTFDLTTLPGGFDVSRASNWSGGTVEGSILTVNEDVTKITYTYSIGNERAVDFTLDWGALPFTDVKKSHGFYDAVEYLYEAGIMKGTGDTTFSPDYTLNRATVVTMLYRLEGEPVVASASTFTDVEADEWYTAAVYWAASEGIVEGYGDGTFGPKNDVTNEQLAAIIKRYAEYKGVTIAETTELPADAIVSDWAVGNVAWAAATGILDEVQTHAATANATRAQVAASIYNYIVNLVK